MKRFLKLTALYILLLLLVLFTMLKISSYIVKKRGFQNHETESNLLVMNSKEKFDILFMGISHARNFSRYKNHQRIEEILAKEIINIGQGGGRCGINEQLFYLDYFYSKKNKASTVVYVISPPLFFSETLPIASNTFDREPFELDFFLRYISFRSENKHERLFSYWQSKLNRKWLSQKPFSSDSKNEQLDSIDVTAITKGQRMVYKDSLALNRFAKSTERVEETILLALKNKSNVVLIIPPAIFGKWKGHAKVEEFARRMQKHKGVAFYDFSETILSPEYYYDHHHLNTNGVVYFTEHYLKPALHKKMN